MSMIKKVFGGLDLTWPKLIATAIIAGVFTAAMAIIPQLRYTSFNALTVTFEVWVMIGIIIKDLGRLTRPVNLSTTVLHY